MSNRLDGSAFSCVLLLIIAFLLVESSLVNKSGVNIELPAPDTELPGIIGPSLVVGLDDDGQYYIANRSVSDEALLKSFKHAAEKNPDTAVIIVADHKTQVDRIAHASALTYQAGLKRILMATKSRRNVEDDPPAQTDIQSSDESQKR